MRLRIAAVVSLGSLGFALASIIACSSFSGEGPTPAPDAGSNETSVVDASDASTADAADARAGLPFCSTLSPAPRFCADFEEGKLPSFYFPNSSGDLSNTTAQAYGGLHSLRAVGGLPGADAVASLPILQDVGKKVVLSYRVRVSAAGMPNAPPRAIASRLVTGVPGSACFFDVRLTPVTAYIYGAIENAEGVERILTSDPGPDTWYELAMTLTQGSGGFVVVNGAIDGKDVVTGGPFESNCPNARLTRIDRVEVMVQSASEKMEIFFDDVVLDAPPP